jgi:hypothetical protein
MPGRARCGRTQSRPRHRHTASGTPAVWRVEGHLGDLRVTRVGVRRAVASAHLHLDVGARAGDRRAGPCRGSARAGLAVDELRVSRSPAVGLRGARTARERRTRALEVDAHAERGGLARRVVLLVVAAAHPHAAVEGREANRETSASRCRCPWRRRSGSCCSRAPRIRSPRSWRRARPPRRADRGPARRRSRSSRGRGRGSRRSLRRSRRRSRCLASSTPSRGSRG